MPTARVEANVGVRRITLLQLGFVDIFVNVIVVVVDVTRPRNVILRLIFYPCLIVVTTLGPVL